MNKMIFRLSAVAALVCGMVVSASAQTVTVSNFIGLKVPSIMASGGTSRIPFVFTARVEGLTPNTTYRFWTQATISSDIGGTNSGAGNPYFIAIDNDPVSFTYTTGTSMTTAGQHSTFTTNASGEYTGAFSIVQTANARFNAGNNIRPTITLALDSSPSTIVARYALDLEVTMVAFGTTATTGTGIWGATSASDKTGDLVFLYDNTAGTGRPIGSAWIQAPTYVGAAWASGVAYYTNNVYNQSGRWGAFIPNDLPNGVRRIERVNRLTGAVITADTSANGVWGSVNTVNPNGGTSAIELNTPLPVELSSFMLD